MTSPAPQPPSVRSAAQARVTLKDVAARAGVSTAAASQALNGRGALSAPTRDRILAVAAELGYSPDRFAAALRRGRTQSIGYVGDPPPLDAREPDAARDALRHLTALVTAAADHDFTVTVLPAGRPHLLRGARVDALYLPDARPEHPALRAAAELGIPIITNDLAVEGGSGLSVRTGYEDATRAALDLLLATGAERVAFLAEDSPEPRARIGEHVYRRWCGDHAREPVLAVVQERADVPRAARELVRERVDAVFSSYPHGPEVLVQFEASTLVIPRDLQFATLCLWDCEANARLGITRACVHPDAAPALLMPRLLALLDGTAPEPATIDLPWELVRGSTTR
jgi:DNA-binding LacI/PurR family transcriptional regulator